MTSTTKHSDTATKQHSGDAQTPSRKAASIGRIVHVHAPSLWEGARAGIIVGVHPTDEQSKSSGTQLVNVNPFLDGTKATDRNCDMSHGHTFGSLELFDSLTDEQRHGFGNQKTWAEWPPAVN